jgi:glucokinase
MVGISCVFDIGGTNTRMAISTKGTKLDNYLVAPTGRSYHQGLKTVAKLYQQLFANGRAGLAVGGVAGTFNKLKTQTLNCPQLPDWVGRPLRYDLAKIFHCPVALENDAALGGLGEAVVGAGQKFAVVGYFTIGTEVGGSRIVDGRIDRTAYGFEPGKQLFYRRQKWQSLEQIIGGRAMAREQAKPAEQITDPAVWRELRAYLAYGLRNAVALWSPEVLILGGSVMAKLWPVKISPRLASGLIWPPIRRGRLGDRATLIGALVYLQNGAKLVRR